jgi:dGTPase
MARHSGRRDRPEVQPYLDSGQLPLEAQVVDAADGLAYDTHDVDDALGTGLITLDDLNGVEFWRKAVERVKAHWPHLAGTDLRTAATRELIDWQVRDLLAHTGEEIRRAGVASAADVRRTAAVLVNFGPVVRLMKGELERFLHARVYRHHRVMRMAVKGQRFLTAMYAEFLREPDLLPVRQSRRLRDGPDPLERVVGDYLAGMTDRYARREYERLFLPSPGS